MLEWLNFLTSLNRLWDNLLNLLGHNRVFAVVEGVGLASRLAVGVAASGMDLWQFQHDASFDQKSDQLTDSGRLSSRPLGAASWTLWGTALCPVAWEAPCPCSLVEDILIEVCLKMGDDLVNGREMVRS